MFISLKNAKKYSYSKLVYSTPALHKPHIIFVKYTRLFCLENCVSSELGRENLIDHRC